MFHTAYSAPRGERTSCAQIRRLWHGRGVKENPIPGWYGAVRARLSVVCALRERLEVVRAVVEVVKYSVTDVAHLPVGLCTHGTLLVPALHRGGSVTISTMTSTLAFTTHAATAIATAMFLGAAPVATTALGLVYAVNDRQRGLLDAGFVVVVELRVVFDAGPTIVE